MSNNNSSFDNSDKIKRNNEEHYNTEGISPIKNYYVSSGKKKISKDLEILENIEAKKSIKIKGLLIKAKIYYNLDYVKQLIELSRYYSKDLNDFELSKEKENKYLENIHNLQNCEYGNESSKIQDMLNTITYINELEQRLENKGLIQKKSTIDKFNKRVARKESDSK